ncbi:MAG: hypothetical protein K940chlam9_00783 [Chlamydiae bacterium]|nr:hypothetical protein [Chlamydiota bacterium]
MSIPHDTPDSIKPDWSSLWISPLKLETNKRPIDPEAEIPQSTRRKLHFGQKENKGSSKNKIVEITNYPFFNTQSPEMCADYFHLREQVDQIEERITLFPAQEAKSIKERINSFLENPHLSTEEKLAELGMMLFYLDRNGKVSLDSLSLVKDRASEIRKQVEEIIQDHTKSYIPSKVPSGKGHYLLRAFAHMTVTSTQKLNRGALLALKRILQDPSLHIVEHLQAEHRTHILAVVDGLLNDRRIPSLLSKQIGVSPDLQNLIRWDMKLAPKDRVQGHHVLWAALMSLFFDLRQEELPNCYAIASLLYISEHAPYEHLEALLKWLICGKVSLPGLDRKIPISQLIQTRLPGSKELEVFLSSEKGLALTPMRHLFDTLEIDPNLPLLPKYQPLNRLLDSSLESTEAGSQKAYAKQLYAAYKYNTLVHMQLPIMEFTAMNYKMERGDFLNTLASILHPRRSSSLTRTPEEIDDLKKLAAQFKSQLYQRILFANESATLESRGLQEIPRKRDVVERILKSSVGVYLESNGKLQPLHSFSSLQKALDHILTSSFKAVSKEISNLSLKEFRDVIYSDAFCTDVAKFCLKNLKQPELTAYDLKENDFLLLKQNGASYLPILEDVYGVKSEYVRLESHSPRGFLTKLIETLQKLDSSFFEQTKKVLLSTSGTHIWTLAPTHWKSFQGVTGTTEYLQDEIYQPAREFLKEQIPKNVYRAILDRYCGKNRQLKRVIEKYFSEFHSLTYGEFRSHFFKNCRQENLPFASEVLDQELWKVLPKTSSLPGILAPWGYPQTGEALQRLQSEIGNQPLPPYQLARIIAKHLQKHEIGLVDPFELELAICSYACLPPPVHLGDMNWTPENVEDPSHTELILRYNWAFKQLSFFIREENSERLEDEGPYRKFQLSYPSKFGTKIQRQRVFVINS